MKEDQMVGWHHQLDGHEFEQALGVGDGQGSLVCCSPWGQKESDTTELTILSQSAEKAMMGQAVWGLDLSAGKKNLTCQMI